jgi:hypothetical protein
MPVHRTTCAVERVAPLEVKRLRKLNDAVVGKRVKNVLATFLRRRPQITNAPAACEEYRSVADRLSERSTIVRPEIADETRPPNAERVQTRELTKVNRAIADIRIIREIDERTYALASYCRTNTPLDSLAQTRYTLGDCAHSAIKRKRGSA